MIDYYPVHKSPWSKEWLQSPRPKPSQLKRLVSKLFYMIFRLDFIHRWFQLGRECLKTWSGCPPYNCIISYSLCPFCVINQHCHKIPHTVQLCWWILWIKKEEKRRRKKKKKMRASKREKDNGHWCPKLPLMLGYEPELGWRFGDSAFMRQWLNTKALLFRSPLFF